MIFDFDTWSSFTTERYTKMKAPKVVIVLATISGLKVIIAVPFFCTQPWLGLYRKYNTGEIWKTSILTVLIYPLKSCWSRR